MGLFARVKSSVNSVLPKLFNDPDLAEPLVWKLFEGSVFSATQGYNIETFSDHMVTGIRLDRKEQSRSGRGIQIPIGDAGAYQYGTVSFVFKSEEVPEGVSLRDRLTDQYDRVYMLLDIKPVMGLITEVTAQGVATT